MISVQVDVANGRARPAAWARGSPRTARTSPSCTRSGPVVVSLPRGHNDPERSRSTTTPGSWPARRLPLYLIEGGWPSTSAPGSSPEEQRRYIERQARLLDTAGAPAWFQITFTDLDVRDPRPRPRALRGPGLVDTSLQPRLRSGLGRGVRRARRAALTNLAAIVAPTSASSAWPPNRLYGGRPGDGMVGRI